MLYMTPIGKLLILIMDIVVWIVIVDVIMSWLINFDVVNRSNNVVRTVQDFCRSVSEPLLRPIRNVVPPIGGLDLSPIVLIVVVWFLKQIIFYIGL